MIKKIIPDCITAKSIGRGVAPVNIALIKYFGKRQEKFNLPLTSSLSISLNAYTRTSLKLIDHHEDVLILNGSLLSQQSSFFKRVSEFLDLFRVKGLSFHIETINDLPTGAGLASSASGFAALVFAMNDLFGWDLPKEYLSILARMGSGSACRSILNGFVVWNKGNLDDGMDSYAHSVAPAWPDLRLGVVIVNKEQKKISSRDGMNHTVATSPFVEGWCKTVDQDLKNIQMAIHQYNFELMGQISEYNAMGMHAMIMASRPFYSYFEKGTWDVLEKIQSLRASGIPCYATMDAGPNVKILFLKDHESAILSMFTNIKIYLQI